MRWWGVWGAAGISVGLWLSLWLLNGWHKTISTPLTHTLTEIYCWGKSTISFDRLLPNCSTFWSSFLKTTRAVELAASRNLADVREGQVVGASTGASGFGRGLEWFSPLGLSTSGRMLWGFWLLAGPNLWGGGGAAGAVWLGIPTADLGKILQEGPMLTARFYSQDVEVRKLKRGCSTLACN